MYRHRTRLIGVLLVFWKLGDLCEVMTKINDDCWL